MSVHVSDIRVTATHHFEITIDGAVISFQECSGLTLENEKIEYRHGNSPVLSKEVRIGLTKMPDITFKKGIFEGDSHLIDLFNKTFDKAYMSHIDERFDVLINLLDETGAVVMSWNATSCVVIKLEGPTMKSDESAAAIESLTIAIEGLHVSL
jgi:phage tail-like protein